MSKSEHGLSTDGFVAFPIHSLVAVFHGVNALDMAVSELKNSGFVRDEMRSFAGEEGMLEMDFDGSAHGSMAELLRSCSTSAPPALILIGTKNICRRVTAF